jgi:arylsulfatase A-like enzyme
LRPSSGPGSYGASVLPFVENLQNLVQMEDALPPLGDYTSPHPRTLRRCQGYRNGLRSLMRVDRFIGDAFDLLRRKGEMDNTYFVFYTDNGAHFGQHRFEHGKLQPYEEDVNFPLYVRGPGIPRGVVKPELVGNHDIAPTLADMAGADVPNFVDGRSCPSFLRKLIRRPQVFAPASCCGHLCVSARSARLRGDGADGAALYPSSRRANLATVGSTSLSKSA